MDGMIDGWVYGLMAQWINGIMNRLKNREMDGWMDV